MPAKGKADQPSADARDKGEANERIADAREGRSKRTHRGCPRRAKQTNASRMPAKGKPNERIADARAGQTKRTHRECRRRAKQTNAFAEARDKGKKPMRR
ncbi:hypothetical protein AB4Y32_24805 [Paraburkholderia phymatum]|uniref:Uncharacterized protein n=1 Tax=Paraburkholderia phymatum TaxID=148447 RepID=A0ACC6U5R5_9BURK